MNLAAKYNRTELIRDGEIQAWKGVERSTGEAVVLYLYTGEISGGQPLSEFARGSLAQSLGTGETQVDGGVFGLSPCMVARVARVGMPAAMPARTPDPPVFSAPPAGAAAPHFQDAVAPQAESAPTPVPAVSTSGGPGDFTAMFGAAVAGIGDASSAADTPAAEVPKPAPIFTAPAPLASAPDVPAVDAAKNVAPPVEPMGEFTSLFRAAGAAPAPKPAAEGKPVAEAPVTPTEPQKPAAPPHPGVFTSLYMAANPADVPAEAPPAEPQAPIEPAVPTPTGPAAPPHPGVFTSLYMAAAPESTPEGATPEASPSPEVPLAVPAAEPSVEKAAMGEFTSLFMAAKSETAPAKPATPARVPFTPATESAPAAFVLPEAQAQPMSEQQEDPGEFTMAFRSADPPAPASKGMEEAAPEAASLPSLEAAPPESSFDETAELDVGGALPFLSPANEPVIPATPLRPSEEKEIRAESAPGDFTRLFVATPGNDTPGEMGGTSSKSPIVAPDLPVAEPEAALPIPEVASPGEAASEVPESATEEAERFSSASPAKGPIRFVASDKPAVEDASKPPRSPLQSGSFSQTYVSADETPVTHEPSPGVPAAAEPQTQMPPASRMSPSSGDAMPGEFTMLFASPGGAKAEPTPAPVVTPAPTAQPTPPSQPAPLAEAAPANVAKPAPGGGPGEFTRFFQPGEVDKLKQELAAMSPAASAASPAPPVQEQPAGEFTRMFSAAEIASRVEKPKDPGVFTNLYLAADQKSATIDAPATPAASAGPPMFTTPAPAPEESGGSFTSMFRAAEGGVAPSTPAPASADVFMPPTTGGGFGAPAMSSASDEPSFTRYFQASDMSASPVTPQQQDVAAPSPDLPAYSSGYSKGATSFFQAVPQAAAPAAPVEQGPGEYTRMISGDEVRQAMAGPGGQPGAAAPGAAAPGAAGGGGGMSMPIGVPMSAPSVSGPYVQGPRMTGPQMSGPQISSSGISAPHLQGPHMSGPQMSGPQVHAPHMATPQLQTPHLQVPPMQAPGGTPVAPGQQAPAGGSGASKIIIIATVLVTVIAVVLVLMVAYFILKG